MVESWKPTRKTKTLSSEFRKDLRDKNFAIDRRIFFVTTKLGYIWLCFSAVSETFEVYWFTKFGNVTIYYIWNIQVSIFSSVSYLKDFGTSKLEFETVELY